MDLYHYRQREQSERLAAARTLSESDRAAHLELAESYRSVIEAYERLAALRPGRAPAPDAGDMGAASPLAAHR